MLKRTFIGLVRSYEQTGEKSKDPALKTRYYKLSKDKVWDEIVRLINRTPGFKVLHEVKNVGEIVVVRKTMTGRTQDITFTLFAINPIKTAVDIYSASRGSIGDFGSNYRTILTLYNALDNQLPDKKIK